MFDKNKVKEVAKLSMIELDDKDIAYFSNEIIDFSENKEDFVYPVQFTDYKYELSKTRFFVSRFNQLYNLGTGGEFEYPDSQILFHKSMDLVDLIDSKNYMQDQSKKSTYNHRFNGR